MVEGELEVKHNKITTTQSQAFCEASSSPRSSAVEISYRAKPNCFPRGRIVVEFQSEVFLILNEYSTVRTC